MREEKDRKILIGDTVYGHGNYSIYETNKTLHLHTILVYGSIQFQSI